METSLCSLKYEVLDSRECLRSARYFEIHRELVRLGKYGKVRVELDFVYNSSFNVPNWDPVRYEEIPVLVDSNFLMKYFPLSTASESIDLVLV
ncbi:hypothetical protein CC2G_006590 [Coprinopsis cinerea AmutBmut pab1-1]|nr:hypothetical protein CC2G_006590 [Coprinopsis cinerea AmutBmut pab1-1]